MLPLSHLPPLQGYHWHYHGQQLQLLPDNKQQGGALWIDLDAAWRAYQKEQIGIKQSLAKACGLTPTFKPRVLDATAGLLSDAFLLAYLGCTVSLLESHEAVYCLIANALATANNACVPLLQLLDRQSAQHYLANAEPFDVVYLDPMFPERKKAAKVKKAMQYLHEIVGLASEEEEQHLLALARRVAIKRVVVKRPKLAPFLAGQKPSHQITGKTIRFDVYMNLPA